MSADTPWLLNQGVPVAIAVVGIAFVCATWLKKLGPIEFREDRRELTIATGALLLAAGFFWLLFAPGPGALIVQSGETRLEFTNKSSTAGRVEFQTPFQEIPTVLVSECNSRGYFLIVKTDEVSESSFIWAAAQQDGQSITYSSRLCWIALVK